MMQRGETKLCGEQMAKRTFSFTIEKCYQYVIVGFFWGSVFLLTFYSIFSTSYITTTASEITFFVRDSVIVNIAAVGAFVLVLTLLKKTGQVQGFFRRVEQDDGEFFKLRRILLSILFTVSLIWALSTQYQPGADQYYVQKAVYALHIKDYYMFADAGYMSGYHNQLGLMWLSYLFSNVFGSYNYICFQIMNVIGITAFYCAMSDICAYFGLKRTVQLGVLLSGILFFPLIMYCSFVYGNIWGLACAVLAIKSELAFFTHGKRRSAVYAAVEIVLAVVLKSNYLIFMIGMLVYAAMKIITAKSVRLLFLPCLIVVLFLAQSVFLVKLSERVSGHSLDQGASSWAWIAMGLQESDKAPGWYNGYNWNSYRDAEYQTEMQAQNAKEDIVQSVRYFMSHKGDAVRFFSLKTASQWNNPTFQSFWINQVRRSGITPGNWVASFMSAGGTHLSAQFLNLFQVIVLFGTLLYCVLYRNTPHYIDSLIFALIFVGGFVFHLFWEAKGQYTISYFVLLFPYAVAGYGKLSDQLLCRHERRKEGDKQLNFISGSIPVPLLLFTAGMIAALAVVYSDGHGDYLTADTEKYLQYLDEHDITPVVSEGTYQLKTSAGTALSLVGENTENSSGDWELTLADGADPAMTELYIVNYQGTTWLYFTNGNLYLNVSDSSNRENQVVTARLSNMEDTEEWTISKAPEGGVYIQYSQEYALTYDETAGVVYVSSYTGNENQIWFAQSR